MSPQTSFPTAIAGSLPKPAWLAETNKLWPRWRAEGAGLQQHKLDATLLWIKEQEDAGIAVIGDGERSRQHFVHGSLEQVEGIDIVQFDEPAFNVHMDDAVAWGVRALERAAQGLACTHCGMAPMPREAALAKLRALAAGVALAAAPA